MAEEKRFKTEYDPTWKDALDFAPELFLKRYCPGVVKDIDWTEGYQSLDDQLNQLGVEDEEGVLRVDRLLLFKKHSGDPLYIHIEVQCYHDTNLGRRVMSYRHRLRAKYGVPVVTIVVFGDDSSKWCPKYHTEGEYGSTDTCKWITVKLLKIGRETPDLENEENVFSLFIAAHLAALKTSGKLPERRDVKKHLLGNLQQRKLDRADGQEWYRLLDWILTLPEEMNREVHQELYRQHTEEPMKYVSYAERSGFEKGKLESLRSVLDAKFGADGTALLQHLGQDHTVELLDSLTRAAARATSLEEIRGLFQPSNGHP